MIDQHYKDLSNYMAFPRAHWTKIRTTNLLENTNRKLKQTVRHIVIAAAITNLLENTNRKLKQRSKMVGAFTNDAPLLRLAGTLLMDREKEWKTGYKRIDLEENPTDETEPIIQITAKY